MATIPTTMQCCMRLCYGNGFMGHAIFAPIFGTQPLGAMMSVTPDIGLAQGRIVSISRGSPPPKKR
jgi:hypothetical protein